MTLPAGRFITAKARAVDAATAAIDLSWVDMNGVAVVPAAGDRIVLHSVTVSNRTAVIQTVHLFQDTDAGNDLDAGEVLESFLFAGIASYYINYDVPVPTIKINAAGTNDLHILAVGTAAIDYIVRARILQAST